MKPFKIAGKFLDQPILVAKFKKSVPYLLAGGGTAYVAREVKKAPTDKKNTTLLQTGITMFFTVLSALIAPKIVNKIFKNPTHSIKEIKQKNTEIIDDFVKKNNIDQKSRNILEKAKEEILNIKELKDLNKTTNKNFMNKLIPEPENISSKDIFSEIGRLSLLGLIPVLGGIGGGIAGDIMASENWKEKIPNKIKEGLYQYLANIFLCNVGAGIALAILEKAGVKGKTPRAIGMIIGIATLGIIGGSAIANTISSKIINPVYNKKQKTDYTVNANLKLLI